jgi:uncharacterized protein (DUF302 family)
MVQMHRLDFIKQVSVLLLFPYLPLKNATNMNPKGVIVHQSKYPVKDTIDRLVVLLQARGVTVYARINQQTELNQVGQKILPLEFLMFGNPRAGGPVMAENPLVALDLPLKVIAWEDSNANSWIAYNEASYIGERYGLSDALVSSLNPGPLLKDLVKEKG